MKSAMLKILFTVTLFSILSPDLTAANFKKGLWEISFTTSMKGMPTGIMPIPAQIQTQCINSDEFIPENKQQEGCRYSTSKSSNSKLEWNISCKDGKMKGDGEVIYSGTSMSGSMSVEMDLGGQSMIMSTQFKGKYLGSCK